MSADPAPRFFTSNHQKVFTPQVEPNTKKSRYEKGKKEYVHDQKAEYRKQFVDVNFYGLQSKVQNPMNSVNLERGSHSKSLSGFRKA